MANRILLEFTANRACVNAQMPASASDVSRRTFLGVQALRALAAALVVVQHGVGLWHDRIIGKPLDVNSWWNGSAGVDIFFVISGFVMAISAPNLIALPHKARTFLWRRITRIVPLYWIFTTIKIAAILIVPFLALHKNLDFQYVVTSYLFIPLTPPIVVVGWTLNFEMFFYIIFAIVLALELPIAATALPALAVIGTIGFWSRDAWPAFTSLASPIVFEFGFGIILAYCTVRKRLPDVLTSLLLFAGGLVALMTIPGQFALFSHQGHWRAFAWGVPAAAIVTAAVATEARIGSKLPRWLLASGNASYATYLAQTVALPIIGIAMVHFGMTGKYALPEAIILGLIASLIAGEVVHRYVELPILALFKRRRIPGVSVLPSP